MALRVMIVDDEALGRRRLRRLLAAYDDISVVAECATGREAIALLRTHDIDALFLDIQMPGQGGIDVARQISAPRPFVIFVTAFTDFALDAFDVEASDYLVKPVSPERLARTLDRVRALRDSRIDADAGRRLHAAVHRALTETAPNEDSRHADDVQRLRIRQGDRYVFLRAADVDWFEADGNDIRAHVGRTVHTFRETVAGLEDSLDPKRFVRIHRSTIVNIERIKEFEPWPGGDGVVVLLDGTRLRMSRTYRTTLNERLKLL